MTADHPEDRSGRRSSSDSSPSGRASSGGTPAGDGLPRGAGKSYGPRSGGRPGGGSRRIAGERRSDRFGRDDASRGGDLGRGGDGSGGVERPRRQGGFQNDRRSQGGWKGGGRQAGSRPDSGSGRGYAGRGEDRRDAGAGTRDDRRNFSDRRDSSDRRYSSDRRDNPGRRDRFSRGERGGRDGFSRGERGDQRPGERRSGASYGNRGEERRGGWSDRSDRPRSSRPPQSSDQRAARRDEPDLPESITGAELDKHVRGQLSTLSPENALVVAKHLIAAGMFLDEDPELAYNHAMAAEGRAGRIAVVREAAGFAAYHTGRYEQALREFRTVRRITGSAEHLPLIADCERGRGRPERAVELLDAPEAQELDRAGQLELLIVASGARRDLGQAGAAVLLLQVPELTGAVKPSLVDARARLLMAYSEALADDGRAEEAQVWRQRAVVNDPNGVLSPPEAAEDAEDDAFIVDLEETAEEEASDGR